jgi:hypothetical protein
MLVLPVLRADDGEWKTVKTKFVEFGKEELRSVVLRPGSLSGDQIALPGGGLKVKIERSKVLVDVKGKGTPDFVAAQGPVSKPFTVTITYPDESKAKYGIKLVQQGASWGWIRNCGVEAVIGGSKVLFTDDSSNGIYGEEKADAIYFDKKTQGCPYSNIIVAGGVAYEVKINESGTEVQYRAYTGKVGSVDILKEWGGKDAPDTIIVQGNTDAGIVFLDIAAKGAVSVPQGSYSLIRAYLPGVEISQGQSTTFTVADGDAATMKWGLKLKVLANLTTSMVKDKKMFTLNPVPSVEGAAGEKYAGEFMDDARFKFEVSLATANGKPIGRPMTWSPCFS